MNLNLDTGLRQSSIWTAIMHDASSSLSWVAWSWQELIGSFHGPLALRTRRSAALWQSLKDVSRALVQDFSLLTLTTKQWLVSRSLVSWLQAQHLWRCCSNLVRRSTDKSKNSKTLRLWRRTCRTSCTHHLKSSCSFISRLQRKS